MKVGAVFISDYRKPRRAVTYDGEHTGPDGWRVAFNGEYVGKTDDARAAVEHNAARYLGLCCTARRRPAM